MRNPTNERRTDELRRRALADEHRGEVVEGSGIPVEPRRLNQMVSVRLNPEVVGALRAIAASRDTTLSAVLREAAVQYASYAHRVKELRWRIQGETISEAHAWTGPSVSQSALKAV